VIQVKKELIIALMIVTLVFASLISSSYILAEESGIPLRIDVYIKSDTDLKILDVVIFVNESSVNQDLRQYITFIKDNVSIPLIQPKSVVKDNLVLQVSNKIPLGEYNLSVFLKAMIGSQDMHITYSLVNSTRITVPISDEATGAQVYFVIRETDFVRKLEWTCPIPPSKYVPPTTTKPLNATLIYESISPGQRLVFLLINDTLYGDQWFVAGLDMFVRDLSSLGYSVKAYLIAGGAPSDLRSLLKDGLSEGLVGAILIGDLPAAWYEMYCWDTWEQFPTDLFYMDLDGSFVDEDNDGLFDSHFDGEGDKAPEIWVGRLDVPNKYGHNESEILTRYFFRNHWYITGKITVPHRALIYIDDDWVYMAESVDNSLAKIYSERTLVTDKETTNSEDYKMRLVEGYEWVHLQCHGWPGGHTFKTPNGWDGTVHTSDYEAIDPPVFFYQFFVCSGARFVENDYLAGSAVFMTSHGLTAIGSTKTGSMLYFSDFYTKLAEGKPIGEAFKEWFVLHGESLPCWFYGMTIIGNPVLTPRLESAKLYGWVKDLSGNAIEGAAIEVYNYASRVLLNSSVTSAEGYYEVFVPYGNVYLVIHKGGYYTYSSDVFYHIALTERNVTLTQKLLEKKDIMLVVDDDSEYWIDQGTWLEEIRTVIKQAGYDIYAWNESIQGLPPLEALKDARGVFWHTGTRYLYAISKLDAETLLQYVQSGGKLVLEGEDIGYDHGNDTFMMAVAHAYYLTDHAGSPSLEVTLSHPITAGLPSNFTFEQMPPFPDGVAPALLSPYTEVDISARVYNIVDGDTFDAFPIGRIRLADINAPELSEVGGQEAKNALASLILGKEIYLNVDDKYVMDPYNRLVGVAYIKEDGGYLLNVNKWLVENGYATINDYDNEFNPSTWRLYEYYPKDPDSAPVLEVIKYSGTPYSAVIVYENKTSLSKVVYVAFPLHYLAKDIRDQFIRNIVSWLLSPPDLSYFPAPYIDMSKKKVNSAIIVGNSDPHGPCGGAHTLDTVGGMMIAAQLGYIAGSEEAKLFLDTDVAWYNYSEAKVYYWPIEGLTNIITVGGPGVNQITWRYFANPWYAPGYIQWDERGNQLLITPSNIYNESEWVALGQDLAIIESIYVAEEDRYVLLVAGFGGDGTRAACLIVQLFGTDKEIMKLRGVAMIIRWRDVNNNAKVDPNDEFVLLEVVQ